MYIEIIVNQPKNFSPLGVPTQTFQFLFTHLLPDVTGMSSIPIKILRKVYVYAKKDLYL